MHSSIRHAVLPPCAAAVAMKTPAVTAMVGAQTTINNRLNALTASATEMATTMTMEMKAMAAAEARRQHLGGGGHWRYQRQLGKSVELAAAAAQRQRRQWQRSGGSAVVAVASLAAVAAAWQKRNSSAAAGLPNTLPLLPKLLLLPRFPTRFHCRQSCASAKLYELGEGCESDTE